MSGKQKHKKSKGSQQRIADDKALQIAREASIQHLKALEEKTNQLTESYTRGKSYPTSEYTEKYIEWP